MFRPNALSILSAAVFGIAGVAAAQDDDLRPYITPPDVPVRALEVQQGFAGLTDQEKLYAHWMSEASWRGALICFAQVSAESPQILELLLRLFAVDPVELRVLTSRMGVSGGELDQLRQYAARFLSNAGNYLSFGDSKFIPALPIEKFTVIVEAAAHLDEQGGDRLLELFDAVKHRIYSLHGDERGLGFGKDGTSSYYTENVTADEAELMNRFMQRQGIEGWNTRVSKDEGPGWRRLTLHVASIEESQVALDNFEGYEIWLAKGDFADILRRVVEALRNAEHYAANAEQRAMIQDYIRHFESGDIDAHKDAMRHWVKDLGPAVETNLGFIETYRDPAHVRAEWEGLVAVVNKEQSRRFQTLVDAAPKFIQMLPWGRDFEKDAFRKPDFTSLDVLTFANSGIPAGINIPNYDDIRMNEGFKNVSLGNVLSSGGASTERFEFVPDADQDLMRAWRAPAFEVQVGLHELLGHGSGKLLSQTGDDAFNFDRNLINPLTGKAVATWYKPGQTWGSQFGKIASSWEECRAEAVGLYLCHDPDVLRIFGHEGKEAEDVAYVNWLLMAQAGLSALPFYDPTTKVWGQAHMQGRYALMRVMLEAGGGLLAIDQNEQGQYVARLDRSKIATVGRKAIGDFLNRLNIYKATADVEAGKALYEHYTGVDERMLEVRRYAIDHRKPRHIWVQAVTDIDLAGRVVLRTYPPTHQGVIDSFLDRYSDLAR